MTRQPSFGSFVAVMVALILGMLWGSATLGAAKPDWRSDECRYGGITKGGWTQHEVRLEISCAVAKWGVVGGETKAVAVAACESGLQADASNGGNYLGVYQQAASAWPSRQNSFEPKAWDKPLAESAFNGRANVVVSIVMSHRYGWSAWSCA